jgi:hypothetical protein
MKKNQKADQNKKANRIFSFLGIFIVFLAQVFAYATPPYIGNDLPTAFLGTLLGMLIIIFAEFYRPPLALQKAIARLELSKPTPWVIVAIIFSLLAVLSMQLFQEYERTNYIPVLTFWLFAGFCFVAAFVDNLPSLKQIRSWLRSHRTEIVALAIVTLIGFALRFYDLGLIPRVVNGDEGRVGIFALLTRGDRYANPFALWENFGAFYLQIVNASLQIFGVSTFSLRLPAAIGGTLAIPALYLLARQIAGHRIAILAASLLSISHAHIHFSRTVAVAYIQGTWLIPLELFLLLRGLKTRNSSLAAASGILLAIHFSVYLDSQIIAAMVLTFMLIAFIFLRSWIKPAARQMAAFWAGFGIMILPELTYILQHPEQFFDRLNNAGTFQSNWLGDMLATTGQSAFQILGESVVHAFFSLIYFPAFDFYGAQIPLLSLISGAFFLLGLAIAITRTHSPGYLLLNGYFWAGTIAVGMFSTPLSASSYRMLIVLPAAFLLAAIGLDYALIVLGLGWIKNRVAYIVVVGLTLFSLFVFNIWAYFFTFAGQCLYAQDSGPARFASYLGNYVSTVDLEDNVFLLSDETYIYGSHASVDFLSGGHPIINVFDPVDSLEPTPDQVIIAGPSRIAELRTWADDHPGGDLHYEYDCRNEILLAYEFP